MKIWHGLNIGVIMMSETYYNGSCTNMVMRQNGKPCDVSSIDAASECNRLLALNEQLEAKLAEHDTEHTKRIEAGLALAQKAIAAEAKLLQIKDALDNDSSYGRPHAKECPCGRCKITIILTGK